jgi:hypothetical protein
MRLAAHQVPHAQHARATALGPGGRSLWRVNRRLHLGGHYPCACADPPLPRARQRVYCWLLLGPFFLPGPTTEITGGGAGRGPRVRSVCGCAGGRGRRGCRPRGAVGWGHAAPPPRIARRRERALLPFAVTAAAPAAAATAVRQLNRLYWLPMQLSLLPMALCAARSRAGGGRRSHARPLRARPNRAPAGHAGHAPTFTKRRLYLRRLQARPVGFFFLSCLGTLGVWPRTLPARAREP